MNPEKAKQDIKERIVELNDVFQRGQRAKHFTQTEYWQQLKSEFDEEIKNYREAKSYRILDDFLIGYPLKDKEGKIVGMVNGQQALLEAIKMESHVLVLESLLSLVQKDISNGEEAYSELEEIKKKHTPK